MKIKCDVCMHKCELDKGQRGFCRARFNDGERIRPVNYGLLTSLALDPIEKKPLKYFRQGSMILSLGSYGCNLRCPYCQNSEISQSDGRDTGTEYFSPENIRDIAIRAQKDGNIGAAYTYNEPMMSYEYIMDCGKLIKEAGLCNVIVTNGQTETAVLEKVLPYTDAMNIDLKGFSDKAYNALGGSFEMAKEFIKRAAKDCHVELTTLIVPGLTDSYEDMKREAGWIASIDPDIPLHITRFFPRYKMTDRRATDTELMRRLLEIAETELTRVSLGNV
ncbi:MAG: AmmeMemoRadiSam system radical SAM enzyme [Lachnospiraceae bacterium]|nr:AmmeMemoRadiSam system radical SAM enzyme [Lachnospiraceae bacterium]